MTNPVVGAAAPTHQDEFQIRSEKVAYLRSLGIEPWPAARKPANDATQVLELFEQAPDKEHFTSVAGRVMSLRGHGKTMFAHVRDSRGQIQIYFKHDLVGEETYNIIQRTLDLGDIVYVAGTLFRTKTGEVTIQVAEYQMLSKCLHPLPDKFHGIADQEIKYRQRYLDLMTNPEAQDRFKKRSLILRTLRRFMDNLGYLEVETPMLHPIPGGAAAKPFITHHNALDDDFYLRIAPELYLKRLLVGGFDRVYEVNRNFRNEGVSTRHNPEFTMVEFYTAYENYEYAMNLVEELFRSLARTCGHESLVFAYADKEIDFANRFERLAMVDAVKKYLQLTDAQISPDAIDAVLQKHSIKPANKQATYGEKIYALFEELVEPQLINPTFIVDFPIAVSPLARRKDDDKTLAARFELFIAGMEIANSFNELNDPFDQAERFKDQAAAHAAGDDEAHHYDADFIQALEYGMPPTVGVGVGIDRLAMLLTNTPSIREVILFPTLKKK